MCKKGLTFSFSFCIILLFVVLDFVEAKAESESEGKYLIGEIHWREIYDIEKLAEFANVPNVLTFHLAAVRQVRRLLSCNNSPPYDNFIKSGIIPILVKFLDSKNTTLQFDATWILAHIASGTENQATAIVEANTIPSFIRLLNSSNKEILGQALWGLSHIINKNSKNRDKCIEAGIIEALVKLANSESANLAISKNIVWTLKNLCKPRNLNNLVSIEVIQEILPILSKFLRSEDSLILSETLLGIANCGNGSNSRIQTIINHQNMFKDVTRFLKSSNSKIRHSAFNVIKMIANGNNQQIQILLDPEILKSIKALIKSPNKHIKNDILYILEKVVVGNEQKMNTIFDAKFTHQFLKFLNFNDYKIRINAAKIIANISQNPKIVKILIKQNVIRRLCKILNHPFDKDDDVITVLTATKNVVSNSENKKNTVLEEIIEAGGIPLFSRFENYKNEEIKNLTKEIIDFIIAYKKFE